MVNPSTGDLVPSLFLDSNPYCHLEYAALCPRPQLSRPRHPSGLSSGAASLGTLFLSPGSVALQGRALRLPPEALTQWVTTHSLRAIYWIDAYLSRETLGSARAKPATLSMFLPVSRVPALLGNSGNGHSCQMVTSQEKAANPAPTPDSSPRAFRSLWSPESRRWRSPMTS